MKKTYKTPVNHPRRSASRKWTALLAAALMLLEPAAAFSAFAQEEALEESYAEDLLPAGSLRDESLSDELSGIDDQFLETAEAGAVFLSEEDEFVEDWYNDLEIGPDAEALTEADALTETEALTEAEVSAEAGTETSTELSVDWYEADAEGLIEDYSEELQETASGGPDLSELSNLLPAGFDPSLLSEPEVATDVWVNPIYEDVIDPEELIPTEEQRQADLEQACEQALKTAQVLEEELFSGAAGTSSGAADASSGTATGSWNDGSLGSEIGSDLGSESGPETGSETAQELMAGENSGDGSVEESGLDEEILMSDDGWGDVETVTFEAEALLEDEGYYLCEQTAALGDELKDYMKARQVTFSVGLVGSSKEPSAILPYAREALYRAMDYTGVPTEGDYLRFQLGGHFEAAYKFTYQNISFFIVTFTMDYYTNAAQEAAMDAAVRTLVPTLKSAGNAYARVKAAYEYLCKNVTYDKRGYDESYKDYDLMYTGYAALVQKKAVCQGYSVALYRLLLEMGIDCRVIGGKGYASSGSGEHAWNIIGMGNLYYNVDSTWDAGRSAASWQYFLKAQSSSGFDKSHVRDSQYKTSAFAAAYPMSTSDYLGSVKPAAGATVCPKHGTHQAKSVAAESPGCLKVGHTAGTVCMYCGLTLSGREEIAPTGHAYSQWEVATAASIAMPALYVRSCTHCGNAQHKYAGERLTPFIKLNVKKKTITMKRGKTKKLTVQFANGDGIKSFKSLNSKIVSVSKGGKLKAKKKGKTTIVVTLKSGKQKKFKVKVK